MPIITTIHNPQHRPQGIQYYTLVTCTLYQTSHTVPHDHEHVQIVQKTPIILWRILPYCKGVYHFPPPSQKKKNGAINDKKMSDEHEHTDSEFYNPGKSSDEELLWTEPAYSKSTDRKQTLLRNETCSLLFFMLDMMLGHELCGPTLKMYSTDGCKHLKRINSLC